ncbi:MAG: YsnF/AvaK domain-containing protein [Janthinobacterium lividum]
MTIIDRPGTTGPDDDEPVEVVRSEERLDVGTVVRVSGRAVLRRYVVTETVTQTFEVRHEEFRVDHEPVSDRDRVDVDRPGSDHLVSDERTFDDRVVETVLHREVPVVTMRVVATERVRLHVDTVTDQVRVSDDVALERVDVDVLDQLDSAGEA